MQLSLTTLTKPLTTLVSKYHLTLFIVLIAGLLGFAVFALYAVIQIPDNVDDATLVETKINGNFDKKTIERVETLRQSDESATSLTFPGPRSNPFVE